MENIEIYWGTNFFCSAEIFRLLFRRCLEHWKLASFWSYSQCPYSSLLLGNSCSSCKAIVCSMELEETTRILQGYCYWPNALLKT